MLKRTQHDPLDDLVARMGPPKFKKTNLLDASDPYIDGLFTDSEAKRQLRRKRAQQYKSYHKYAPVDAPASAPVAAATTKPPPPSGAGVGGGMPTTPAASSSAKPRGGYKPSPAAKAALRQVVPLAGAVSLSMGSPPQERSRPARTAAASATEARRLRTEAAERRIREAAARGTPQQQDASFVAIDIGTPPPVPAAATPSSRRARFAVSTPSASSSSPDALPAIHFSPVQTPTTPTPESHEEQSGEVPPSEKKENKVGIVYREENVFTQFNVPEQFAQKYDDAVAITNGRIQMVKHGKNGFRYAYIDPDGDARPLSALARNEGDRVKVMNYLKEFPDNETARELMTKLFNVGIKDRDDDDKKKQTAKNHKEGVGAALQARRAAKKKMIEESVAAAPDNAARLEKLKPHSNRRYLPSA